MTPIVSLRGRLFKAAEAAQCLGMTTSKVRKLIARGELVAVRNPNGRLEGVYERDCEAWQEQRRRTVTPPLRPGQVAVDERMKALMPATRAFG